MAPGTRRVRRPRIFSGHSAALRPAAPAAGRTRARFSPGQRDGTAVLFCRDSVGTHRCRDTMETGAPGNVPSSVSLVAAMALAVFRQIRHALVNLNPTQVREEADRPVRVGLVAASHESLGSMERFFVPPHLSPERRAEALQMLIRGGGPSCDVHIFESSLLRPSKAFSLDLDAPEDCVRRIV